MTNLNRLLLISLTLIYCSASAQELKQADFDQYTTADGLSDNSVTGIVQDSTGFLWISTLWGLNRFDGHRFVQYHSTNDSNSLPAEDLWGARWINDRQFALTGTGVHIVDTRTGKTKNLFIPYHSKKYQFKFNMVMSVKGDKGGNLYVLTRSGLYQFNKNDQLVFRFDYYSEAETPVNHFFFGGELFDLDERRLLIISIGGLYVYDKGRKAISKLTADDCPVLSSFLDYPRTNFQLFQIRPGVFFLLKSSSDTIVHIDVTGNSKQVSILPFRPIGKEIGWRSKLLQVNDSTFYLSGQNSGVYRLHFNPRTRVVTIAKKELEAYSCMSLLLDKDKRLVIGTNKGILRQRDEPPAVWASTLPADLQQQYPNLKMGDVYVTAGKIYAGTREAGIAIFNKATLRFEKNILLDQPGSGANYVRGIARISRNELFLGTQNTPRIFNETSNTAKVIVPPGWNVAEDWASNVYRDSKNNIWLSAHNLYRYNLNTQIFTNIPVLPELLEVPTGIVEDQNGNIWLSCHGIARYNTALNIYDQYVDSFPYIKMPDKQVNALAIDGENRVWFSSKSNGLISYDTQTKLFQHFSRKDGLPDDEISSLMVAGKRLWIACYSGIACLDLETHHIINLGKEDGFPDGTIVKNSKFFYDSAFNQAYIGFANALVRFDPEKVLRKKDPPQIFFEDIVVDGKVLHYLPHENITTSWKDKEMTVSIGSLNFSDAASERFAYRLASRKSAPWIDLGKQNSFSISGLSAGTHHLQVKVYSVNNRWPAQIKDIMLTISPPFWLKPWFMICAVILFLWLIYFFFRWRVSAVRKKEMENTKIEKQNAENYKSQFELEQITNYFSTSLAGKKTEDDVLWDVAENLIGRMNYEDCIIYRWNNARTKMVQKAAFGPKGRPEVISKDGFEVMPGQGIVGHVIETKMPLLVSDTRNDNRYRVDDEFRLSELAVPIVHNNELLGVIDSENTQANYFQERDVKVLTTIAALIGSKLKQLESEQSLEAKQLELVGINEQLVEARLSALQAQMNPHFVFNALNSIKRMILDGDSDKASRYLSKFALMIRLTLEHSKETFVTLHENMEYLKAYLDMEKLRFDDSFTYSISADEGLDTFEIALPSMMIQPLVENAIWHGLMSSNLDKKLSVSFHQSDNMITCSVEDNGVGIRQSEKTRLQKRSMHRSVGLENLRKRIKIINEKYHTECSLEIIDLKEAGINGRGTKAILQFNMINT